MRSEREWRDKPILRYDKPTGFFVANVAIGRGAYTSADTTTEHQYKGDLTTLPAQKKTLEAAEDSSDDGLSEAHREAAQKRHRDAKTPAIDTVTASIKAIANAMVAESAVQVAADKARAGAAERLRVANTPRDSEGEASTILLGLPISDVLKDIALGHLLKPSLHLTRRFVENTQALRETWLLKLCEQNDLEPIVHGVIYSDTRDRLVLPSPGVARGL